ncbi:protein of unknown function [Actinacidiphila yanglinensis]|uniref:DUF3893 domain-containing protein n=1 Tax=Actinacidiphila yanglinensis TaxID=310779 RepID=A0A1H6E100_9ACTN|nr:RNaseH domain-containing protein [Actinacidiphila yanglinensis]SEG85232.1 protein of unknown function [Actinacidiphila yanglinensis]SEG91039.1 protein of unknown function [Actinacidiphila yanglinensis]
MLTTLAFLLDPQHLGTVVRYPLSPDFAAAWECLPRYRDSDTSKPVRPAYASLATALSAVTNQPVVLMPDILDRPDDEQPLPTVLVTTDPIPGRLLTRAVRSWERHVRGGEDANTLAPLLADSETHQEELARFICGADLGRPRAPQWFYRVAAWNFAAHVGRKDLHLPALRLPEALHGEGEQQRGGTRLKWLMDTSGSLLAWDHVLTHHAGQPRATGHAMHKIDFRVITLPGESRIAVHALPTFSRLATHWASTRTAFVARGKDTVLRLPVGHRRTEDGWEPYARGFTTQVVDACNLETITLGTNDTLAAGTGTVRALIPAPVEHPLGKGTGTRFNLYLANYIKRAAHKLKPTQVTYERTDFEVTRPAKGPITRDDLPQALAGTRAATVRLLALYDSEYTRERMITALTDYLDDPEQAPPWHDGRDFPLVGPVSVHFRRMPELVSTVPVHWDQHLAFLTSLPHADLTGVWIETRWNPKKRARRDRAEDYDPKRDLRRHFHHRGVVSQFIAHRNRPKPRPATAPAPDGTATAVPVCAHDAEPPIAEAGARAPGRPKVDYPAINGLRDLLLRLGAIDRRLADAVPFTDTALLIGLHLRQQRVSNRTIGSADRTQMVEVLTGLRTSADPDEPWRLGIYNRQNHSWVSLPNGEAAFGSGPIGVDGHARHADGAQLVREHIKAALRILPTGLPVIVFADAEACRTIWPALQHAQLGEGPYPGDDLAAQGRPVAVVTINASYGEVPTPVDRADGRRKDQERPAAPDTYLHRRTTATGVTSWYLAQASRTYNGFGQTSINGSNHTRFTLPNDLKDTVLGKDWHSFTATQITVPVPGPYDPEQLAALTAALCHQSLGWDARTRHPVPLHIAGCVDKNHSEHRGPSTGLTDTDTPSDDSDSP